MKPGSENKKDNDMAEGRLYPFEAILEEDLKDPAFRDYWARTALARAVAITVVAYRDKHGLTQTKLAHQLGLRQPQVARLEIGEHTPSLPMLERLARTLGLRFLLEVAPAGEGVSDSHLILPAGVEVVEDVTSDGSRVLVAASL